MGGRWGGRKRGRMGGRKRGKMGGRKREGGREVNVKMGETKLGRERGRSHPKCSHCLLYFSSDSFDHTPPDVVGGKTTTYRHSLVVSYCFVYHQCNMSD